MGILWFIGGVIVGAGGMFLVYKNNKQRFSDAADLANKKAEELEAKLKEALKKE